MSQVRIGIIGGTGLGEALRGRSSDTVEVETPFGDPSAPITRVDFDGVEVFVLQRHGIGHALNPSQVPYRANIYALKKLGVTHLIASGATGSLREKLRPGDLVIPDQLIDKTYKRANTFYEHAAVHVELADPFCPVMRRWLIASSKTLDGVRAHDTATYVCMEGPAFSTRAECEMHRAWGADLVGMTAMPEARLAREAEIAFALIAMPTDYDCWRPRDPGVAEQDLLAEIRNNLDTATRHSVALIHAALSDITQLESKPSPAHNALRMAIWTNPAHIPPDEINRLSALWGRHLPGVGP